MIRNPIHVSVAGFVLTAVLAAGAADASDHRMWRDQVARSVDTTIKLESRSVDPERRLGNDSLPWREQIKAVRKSRVFVLEPAKGRYTKASDTRLWREQIRSDSSKRDLVAASGTGRTDESKDE